MTMIMMVAGAPRLFLNELRECNVLFIISRTYASVQYNFTAEHTENAET